MLTTDTRKQLSPDLLLQGYASGIFPMSDSLDDPDVFWVHPKKRGILPLDCYHIPRNLKKLVRKQPFSVTFNKVFQKVVDYCSEATDGRSNTWINKPIRDSIILLHKKGFAHSVECWQNNDLVGGLYGVSLGGAFFGESMFSKTRNASKIALVYLLAQLNLGKYQLLDTQFKTDHLAQFGVIEISSDEYLVQLERALKFQSRFSDSAPNEKIKLAIAYVLENSSKLQK